MSGVPPGDLQGWMPEAGPDLPIERIVDLAFDYRGNTTVVRRDGTELGGYVFNRNADVPDPFLQMFDDGGGGPWTIRFSGRDAAAPEPRAARRPGRGRAGAGRAASDGGPTG